MARARAMIRDYGYPVPMTALLSDTCIAFVNCVRKDMQRMLAEVTDHMEQQYSAHKYLEKLRSENESIALKEKERLVSQ